MTPRYERFSTEDVRLVDPPADGRQFMVVMMGRSVDIRHVPAPTSKSLFRDEAWDLAQRKANGIRFITFTGLDGETRVIWEPS